MYQGNITTWQALEGNNGALESSMEHFHAQVLKHSSILASRILISVLILHNSLKLGRWIKLSFSVQRLKVNTFSFYIAKRRFLTPKGALHWKIFTGSKAPDPTSLYSPSPHCSSSRFFASTLAHRFTKPVRELLTCSKMGVATKGRFRYRSLLAEVPAPHLRFVLMMLHIETYISSIVRR